jgi:hypothetical protein
MKQRLIALDFEEHDTKEALSLLQEMVSKGEISGMVFAVQLAHGTRQKRRIMLGATGRPANDIVVATGLTAILQCSITQQAMSETG